MTFPWKYYESDVEKLLGGVMQENPKIADDRAKGLSLWWDRSLDADQLKRTRDSAVKQKPYVYQTKD